MNKERNNIDCAESSLQRSHTDRWLGQRNVGWTVMGTRGAGECGCGHRKEHTFKAIEGGLLYPKAAGDHTISAATALSYPQLLSPEYDSVLLAAPCFPLRLSRSILSSRQRD